MPGSKKRTDRSIQGWFEPSKPDEKPILDAFDNYVGHKWKPKEIIAEGIMALVEKHGVDIPMPQFGGISAEAIGRAVAKELQSGQQELLANIRHMLASGALVASSPEARQEIEQNLTGIEESLGNEFRTVHFEDE